MTKNPMIRNRDRIEARRLAGGFILALLAAGCAPAREDAAQGYHAVLRCDGGRTVQVQFFRDRAVLESGGVSVAMTQRRSGSGIRYAGGGQELRGKGYDLTWTDRAGKAHVCRDTRGDPGR